MKVVKTFRVIIIHKNYQVSYFYLHVVRTGFKPVIDTISSGRSISVSPVGIVTLHFRGVFLSPPDYLNYP